MIAVAVSMPAGAAAHGTGNLGVPGTSEKRLRTFEVRTLGPEHAAEHAAQRRLVREGEVPARASGSLREPATPRGLRSSVGRWKRRFRIPVIGINAIMLPTGKVLWFAYPTNPNPTYGDAKAPNEAEAWLWNPANERFRRVSPPLWRDPADGRLKPANIWCAGNSFTPDGRVVVAGGNLAYTKNDGPFKGLNKLYTFDPFTERWTEQPDMVHGRWYPSQVLMPDGRTTIVGGLDERGTGYTPNLNVDVFQPSRDPDRRGKVITIGNRRDLRDTSGLNTGPPDGGLYPHLFWMPSGRMMVAGPDPADSWFLRDPGRTNQFRWTDYPAAQRRRLWGSGVILPKDPEGSTQIELIGGSNPFEEPGKPPRYGEATNTTETYDEAAPGWKGAAPMNVPRSHLNTVLLPDKSMVSVGGGVGTNAERNQWAVTGKERKIEIYDPATKRWRLGPAQAEARAYHSTAILLPDARVVSAGDDLNGGISQDTAEIYEPPYLFRRDGRLAKRPKVRKAPHTVDYGRRFRVSTVRGSRVIGAALVAPGAATHANDMNQRVVPIKLARSRRGVRLRAPASANIALPGYYMLFLVNSEGVPSVARWVQLGSRDAHGPKIAFSRRSGVRRMALTGRARDRSGVRHVQVAIGARRGKRCRWLVRGRRYARRTSCRRPRYFDARLRRAGKTWVWRAPLRRRVRAGRYLVAVRASDRPGNRAARTGGRAFRVRVRR